MNSFHKSVLLKEAVDFLNVKKGERYIDATLGGGGHTREILRKGGVVLGIDQDPAALNFVKGSFEKEIEKGSLKIIHGNFSQLKEISVKEDFREIAGILLDLGTSNWQLEEQERGFSFSKEAPLDMRMSPDLAVTAKDLVNALNEGELYELFTKYGEESFARPIARAIVTYRIKVSKQIETTRELSELIERVVGRREKIHPATRVFQALRIAVNDELNSLREVLPQAVSLLKNEGRLVVISFHSLEDRIVKEFFKEHEGKELKVLTKKPLVASEEEVKENPKARSAKLRTAEKI